LWWRPIQSCHAALHFRLWAQQLHSKWLNPKLQLQERIVVFRFFWRISPFTRNGAKLGGQIQAEPPNYVNFGLISCQQDESWVSAGNNCCLKVPRLVWPFARNKQCKTWWTNTVMQTAQLCQLWTGNVSTWWF
jgi:hypothetical protein